MSVLPSGGPPGTAGGCAVKVAPVTTRWSTPAAGAGAPGGVTTSISWSLPLISVSSPTSGSTGGPKPVTAVTAPCPTTVLLGQASVPTIWSSASEAVHCGREPVTTAQPAGRVITAVTSRGGLFVDPTGSPSRASTRRPVDEPGCTVVNVSRSTARLPPAAAAWPTPAVVDRTRAAAALQRAALTMRPTCHGSAQPRPATPNPDQPRSGSRRACQLSS